MQSTADVMESTSPSAHVNGRALGVADLLRSSLFRMLYVAETQSVLGNQLGRVALAVLVFQRTHSASETAAIYALTFLGGFVPARLIFGLTHAFAPRAVMVFINLTRAALLLVMAVSGIPIVVLFVLVVVAALVAPAFTAAEANLLFDAFDAERLRLANILRMTTNQLAQVAAFALGGAIVALLNPQWALRVGACSFALSVLVFAGVGPSAPPITPSSPPVPPGQALAERWVTVDVGTVLRKLRDDHHLRALVGLTWLAGFFVVPEGLAAPYASAVGASTASVGILMAAIPAGSMIGAYIVLRLVPPAAHPKVVPIMAVLTGLPLVLCNLEPVAVVSVALWVLSGLFAAYLIDVITSVVHLTPADQRTRMVGLVGGGLIGVQGIGVVAFGVIADHIGPGPAIALAGCIGTVLAVPLALAVRRTQYVHAADVQEQYEARSQVTWDRPQAPQDPSLLDQAQPLREPELLRQAKALADEVEALKEALRVRVIQRVHARTEGFLADPVVDRAGTVLEGAGYTFSFGLMPIPPYVDESLASMFADARAEIAAIV